MYRERVIAWGCGITAFLLIIMAGKSCMGTPQAPKNSNTTTKAATEAEYNIITPDIQPHTEPLTVGYDIFGKPIYATEPPTEETTEIAEGEAATDTTDTALSDSESSFPMETTPEEATTDNPISENPTAETSDEADTSEPPTIPHGFDGNDHRVYDDEGNEVPTIPPDFVIIFE